MDQIRLGVIGCGYWGPNIVRNFVECPCADLIAVADLRPERRAHIQRVFPQLVVTDDYRQLLTMDLDAVAIATPPPTHYSLARECLEHNLGVLIEKPMTLSSQDAEALIEIADARDLVLMAGHTFEYNAAVRALKQIVDSGDLGDIYYIDAVRVNLGLYQPHLNVLWDLAPHDVSILLYLLGQPPQSVSAHGKAYVFDEIHDIVYVNLSFPGNVLAHVHVSWLDPCKVRRITVVGSKKMVVYDDVEALEKIKIFDRRVETPPYTDTFGDFQCSYRYGDVLIPNIRLVEPLRVECQHFAECVAQHTPPQSNGRVGLQVVRVLETAERSLHNGGEMIPVGQETSYTYVPIPTPA